VTDESSANRRYLAIWFPYLPADRLLRAARAAREAPPADPLVFVEKVRGAMRLAAADEAAIALGLTPGLPLADARARIPDLAAFDVDPEGDAALIERLADGCDRYTPMVAIDPPDGLLLDISGATHPFGGEEGLADDIARRLGEAGFRLRLALAGTPEAAHALARHQNAPAAGETAAVRRLPVEALRLDGEQTLALRRAGLKTIGDLAARPIGSFAARFGEAAAAALRRLIGQSDSRIAPRRVPPALLVERRFAEPVARTEDMLAALGELAGEAAETLDRRGQGGRRFAARLYRSDGLVRDLAVETGLPTRDPALLIRLMRERIDALADPIDPGFGFDLIRLAVPVVEPLGPAQLALEGGSLAEGELAALIDRLSTRLGRGRVRRFAARDTHIPEQAAFAFPAIEGAGSAEWDAPHPGDPPLRPLHLFDPPQPIDAIGAEVPDGPPLRFRWRRAQHEVARYEGPERIASEWWRRDGRALPTRDYYRIEDARGRRFWIFRHGLYGAEVANPRWYMHGVFG